MAGRYRFGPALQAARSDAGLSVRAFAREIGLSAGFVCDVEHSRRSPFGPARCQQAEQILGVRPGKLVGLARTDVQLRALELWERR